MNLSKSLLNFGILSGALVLIFSLAFTDTKLQMELQLFKCSFCSALRKLLVFIYFYFYIDWTQQARITVGTNSTWMVFFNFTS